jgi:hypothetical protein
LRSRHKTAQKILEEATTKRLLASSAVLGLVIGTQVFAEQGTRIVNAGTPEPECTFRVNFDRNADMPGYWVEKNDGRTCLPFMPTNQLVPADYKGKDFYGDEFTDTKIKARWAECKKNAACAEPAIAGAKGFDSAEKRDTGAVGPAVDLHFMMGLAVADRSMT